MDEATRKHIRVRMNILVDALRRTRYDDKTFQKFTNPDHPLYSEYKDRAQEMWMDKGFNNGIDYAIHVLNEKWPPEKW